MISSTISSFSPHFLSPKSLLFGLILVSSLQHFSLGQQLSTDENGNGGIIGRRRLLGFKETPSGGGNFTFECSPSGPCVPCQYSEKSDDKYRCSETGYRIPFKCVKTDVTKEAGGKRPQNSRSTLEESLAIADDAATKHRILADSASSQEYEPQGYVTYRSCIQAESEEKLTVLGFEVLMLGLLLVSGSMIFFRRKRFVATAGAGGLRVQSNSRY